MTSVFISHSTKNDAVVAQIRRALGARDVRVWTDSRELAPGAPLEPRVTAAIKGGSRVAILIPDEPVDQQSQTVPQKPARQHSDGGLHAGCPHAITVS